MAEIADDSRAHPARQNGPRSFVASWLSFIAIAFLIYGAFYAWSEALVFQYGDKNRFFMIATAPLQAYDFAILGASHAMPIGFEDYNKRLEEAVGGSIINLSIEGAGVLPNRLMIDYFFSRHSARTVVFFLDSFAFYSRQWNEDQLDTALFKRAPFDLALVDTLLRYPWARGLVAPYVSGFTKMNNQDRFGSDLPDAEVTKFSKTYRPIPQIDRQRVSYLYPPQIDQAELQRYENEFADLIDFIRSKGGDIIVIKPSTPARYRDALPNESIFDAQIGEVLRAEAVPYYDLSAAVVENQYFYDTDHLNRDGVRAFMDKGFIDALHKHLK